MPAATASRCLCLTLSVCPSVSLSHIPACCLLCQCVYVSVSLPLHQQVCSLTLSAGVLHAVALQPGQMLLYESAKCTHGRPQPFKGEYYTSLFTHYRPLDWNITTTDAAIAVPSYWIDHWTKTDFLKAHAGSEYFTIDELRAIWDETIPENSSRRIANTGFDGHWFPHREYHDGRKFRAASNEYDDL